MSKDRFSKVDDATQRVRWAHIWHRKLNAFHHRDADDREAFSADDVIAFLRSRRDTGTPAWKRLRIIDGLIQFRQTVQRATADDLLPLRSKMLEIIALEASRDAAASAPEIPNVVGKIDPREPDVIQAFRRAVRAEGLAYQTEKSYVGKIKKFMKARGLKTQSDFDRIDAKHVETYLTDMAVDGHVAASTQNAAFHALLKLFQSVLERSMGEINAIRASRDKPMPTVLSTREVQQVLDRLEGTHRIIAMLLYGCGLRISEALRLRVKDLDFDNRLIQIWQSKGGKSRLVPMPAHLVEALRRLVGSREVLHRRDLEAGVASVYLPYALDRKYPNAHQELRWQYLFASDRRSRDPRTGRLHRHHLHADTFPRQLRRAVEDAEVLKYVTSHTFRHCFATHLMWNGVSIREIQELLGHADIQTTRIYTHVALQRERPVESPLDRLVSVG